LAARLRTLYEHADSPPYKAITEQGRKQQPSVRFADATLSDWFAGRTVPAQAQAFMVLVTWLESRAKSYPGHQALDVRAWEALRAAAWHERQAARRPGPGQSLDAQVRGYLEAAGKAAEQHPYPGVPGQAEPPPLAQVYVRQRSRPAARDSRATAHRDDVAAAGGDGALAAGVEPAEAVFRATERVCVLIAGPGGGKSTLLRARLREVADQWLGGTHKAEEGEAAIPVWVGARDLTDEGTSLPDALAAATRKLSRYGRHPELDRTRFLQPPCPAGHWLLLVDGLDEVPNAQQRRAVLQKLAHAVAGDPPLYRCVVATRPLAESELDALDRALGHPAPRYQLRPFTLGDLRTYIDRYLGTRWPRPEAARRARRFTDALRSASLAEPARTPLMAFMLCQLYLADPERALPRGRTAVYKAFTDLIYTNNRAKRVAESHEEAITHLVQGIQTPRERRDAEQVAWQVCDRLSELIDYLAHRWLTGSQAPAAAALASYQALRCPDGVYPQEWNAFLEDLLRHTGLLLHQAHGLGFLHQTFLEYHAARHATRDTQARRQTLDHLLQGEGWLPNIVYNVDQSYLGFLLDGLLVPHDSIAAETTERLEELAHKYTDACGVLAWQLRIRTNLPDAVVRQLIRITEDTREDAWNTDRRIEAASALAEVVEAFRDTAADLLIRFAKDPTASQVRAARYLAEIEGYRDIGAELLIRLAEDPAGWRERRVSAARHVAEVDGYQDAGARILIRLLEDPAVTGPAHRIHNAWTVARIEGYQDAGAELLIRLAEDPAQHPADRVWAARDAARMPGHRREGAALLTRLAEDHALDAANRAWAANALTKLDETALTSNSP
jgi:hypothetical protein